MINVFVTGGAGYVGSHCCKALAAAGYTPVVFDNFSTGHNEFVKWGPLVEGDIRDTESVKKALDNFQPTAVLHFAALSSVGESFERPEDYYKVNIGGTLSLLNAMRETAINKLVYSSSAAVYGDATTVPIVEQAELKPKNPYGNTKLACENLIKDFGLAYGLRSVCLRYFNAAGADPDGDIGENHIPETHLIPLVLDVALKRRNSIKVYGGDYSTPDGSAIRDYVHVVDLASAHVAAVKYLLNEGKGCVLNVGNGIGTSVLEIVEAVERICHKSVLSEVVERRKGDPTILVADPSEAIKILKWKAVHNNIDKIITDAWRWHVKAFT